MAVDSQTPPVQGTNGSPAGGTNPAVQGQSSNPQSQNGQNAQGSQGQQPNGTDRLQTLYTQSPQLEPYLKHLESEARQPLLAKINILSQEIDGLKKTGASIPPSAGDATKDKGDKPLTRDDLDKYFADRQNAEKATAEQQKVEQEKGAFVQKFPEAIPHLAVLPNLRTTFGLSFEGAWEFYKSTVLSKVNTNPGTPPGSQASNTNTSSSGGSASNAKADRASAQAMFESKYLG